MCTKIVFGNGKTLEGYLWCDKPRNVIRPKSNSSQILDIVLVLIASRACALMPNSRSWDYHQYRDGRQHIHFVHGLYTYI